MGVNRLTSYLSSRSLLYHRNEYLLHLSPLEFRSKRNILIVQSVIIVLLLTGFGVMHRYFMLLVLL